MTEKRFEVVMNEFDEVEYIMDKVAMEDRDFADFIDFVEDVCNENEQLKEQLSEQGTQIDFLQAENKHLGEVLRENKQLKCILKQLESEYEDKGFLLAYDMGECENDKE